MKNYKVLIDGFNLRIAKGSGIKYYTISLIKALENYINISLLFDYKLLNNKELLLQVEFMEKYIKGDLPLNTKKQIFKDLMLKKTKDFTIKNDTFLEKDDIYLNNKEILNINNLFNLVEGYTRFNQVLQISAKEKFDIFHTSYMLNLNLRKAKRITTIHDIIPLKIPQTTLDNKKLFYEKVKTAIKTSDKIITISEHSRNDILENFDIAEDKVINCFQPFFLPKDILDFDMNVKQFDLKKEEYFLFVGNIEPKKNIGRVIQAFKSLDTNKKLVIVGRKAWLWEELLKGTDKLIKNKKIILLDYVTREDLIALYKNAFFFVFPSLYEGFGLPPLEAMACKCPVITSNSTSLPEVCEDAAIYCDPYSTISIQNSMEKALNMDMAQRGDLIAKGIQRVEFFNEKDYTDKVLNVYKSVL